MTTVVYPNQYQTFGFVNQCQMPQKQMNIKNMNQKQYVVKNSINSKSFENQQKKQLEMKPKKTIPQNYNQKKQFYPIQKGYIIDPTQKPIKSTDIRKTSDGKRIVFLTEYNLIRNDMHKVTRASINNRIEEWINSDYVETALLPENRSW